MRTKHLLATLVVGVVVAATLGVAVGVATSRVRVEVGAGATTTTGAAGDKATGAPATGNKTTGGRAAGETAGRTGGGQERLSQPDLIAKVKPSVVRLVGSNGGGSGVVVDAADGLVLTNAHVTFGMQGMRARVGDDPGSETAARLVAAAPCDDLAVVELLNRPANRRAIRFGNSSALRPGDHVTALGYPGSLQQQPAGANSTQAQQLVPTDGKVSVVNLITAPSPSYPRLVSTSSTRRTSTRATPPGHWSTTGVGWSASTPSAAPRPRGSSTRSAPTGCARSCPTCWPAMARPTWDGT